jgi:hypothetical protein
LDGWPVRFFTRSTKGPKRLRPFYRPRLNDRPLSSDAVAPFYEVNRKRTAEERLSPFGASVLWVNPSFNLIQAASEMMHESVLDAYGRAVIIHGSASSGMNATVRRSPCY